MSTFIKKINTNITQDKKVFTCAKFLKCTLCINLVFMQFCKSSLQFTRMFNFMTLKINTKKY